MGTNIYADLQRKAAPLITWHGWRQVNYLLFSKTGFTPAMQAQAAAEGVQLVSVDEMI